MKLLNFGSFSLLSAFVALVACSSSDATTGGGVATSGASCQLAKVAGCDAAVSCSKQHCGSEVISCFGQDLKSGSCSSFVTCIDACTCTDTNCIASCEASAITDPNCGPCLSATGALRTCTTASNCDAACGAAGAGGGAGAGSAGYAGTVGTAGAGTAGAGTTAGFGGDLGTAGAGTAGLGGGTAGAGGGAGWYCTQSGTDCVCVTGVGVSADTCTSRPPCCIHFTTGGTEGCECVDLTGTGVMCSALATQLTGTVESTCPPP